jgi:hypothetical protein
MVSKKMSLINRTGRAMKKLFKGVPCISCGEIMVGVYSFEIRKVCKECGGKACPVSEKEAPPDNEGRRGR